MKQVMAMAALLLAVGSFPAASQAGSPALDQLSVRFLQGEIDGAAEAPRRDIRVDIWADVEEDETLRRGEEFTLNFTTNADLYVVIYKIDVEGRVEVIWPERRHSDGFVYGNHTYTIPRPGQAGRLRVGDVKGVEYIEAIASKYPFDLRTLGIDFRFDGGSRTNHGYHIDGDPFLAVNDINYAITGLEEDVDYVVTDWMHLYVDEQVEYARYSCNQCHLDDSGYSTVRPYVDTCTQVEVRVDWGWYRGWYVSFGWYPLYYEPAFYYWDSYWSRPYWYAWYPVAYRWPAYSCYTRPYPVYWWSDSGYYKGDYASHWSKRRTRSVPLYDVSRTKSRTTEVATRDGTRRTTIDRPVSGRGADGSGSRSVDRDRLVRNSTPPRQVDGSGTRGRTIDTGAVRDPGENRRSGIRTGERARERIVSQRPAVERDTGARSSGRERTYTSDPGAKSRPSSEGRRWTRPRVQSERPGTASGNRSGSGSVRDTRRDPQRSPAVDRARDRSSGQSSGRSGASGSVDRPPTQRSRESSPPPRSSAKPDRSRSGSGGNRGAVKPAPSAPRPQPKSQPAPRSRSGSGSSKGRGGRG